MKRQQLKPQWSSKRILLTTICLTFILAGSTSCKSTTNNKPATTSSQDNRMSINDVQNVLSNLNKIPKVDTIVSGKNSITSVVLDNQLDWKAATIARINNRDKVEVPFSLGSTELIAIHKHSEYDIDTSYVTQELLFHRNNLDESGHVVVYTMSLIPDSRYNGKHSEVNYLFSLNGDKGNFTGLVLFHNYHKGYLREIAQYIDGKCVYFRNLNYEGKSNYKKRLEEVKKDIGDLRVIRKSLKTERQD